MTYALLIVETQGQREKRSDAEAREQYARMVRFGEDLKNRGLLSVAQSLASDRSGARVRVQGGEVSVKDGPFSEAKEIIGGFLLLTCTARSEAIAIARECPAANWATVEVRELGPCVV